MGKVTGFLEYDRQEQKYQLAGERVRHFREFTLPLDDNDLKKQAGRCMDCGIPFCHGPTGCPVHNQIPDWNDLVWSDDWEEAARNLHTTNNFPEFTGRICPAPCEEACTLNLENQPVTIKTIEQAIADKAWEMGFIKPEPAEVSTGKRVAVIGSGPAGLAAAQQLARAGPITAGDYVRIDVTDTGEGMDKETRDRIFEPFFTTKFLGRGLGLSAALGIVRGHHGAIGVLSQPEKGTTFTVLLPVMRESASLRHSGAQPVPEQELRGVGTVLVVDDDYSVRSLAESVLRDAGYTVELAENGVQAIERLRDLGARVNLILLDLTMPQLGGAEAAVELRRLQPEVPIIAMSGYGDVEVIERFGSARLDDLLPKPFSPDQLAAKVRDVLSAVAD